MVDDGAERLVGGRQRLRGRGGAALKAAGQVGILTAGGDCPGLNAVIRAVVRSLQQQGVGVTGILDGFLLEVAAVRRVREAMGLTNLQVMVPFCRTPQEGRRVLAEMALHGLARGRRGLEVHVMCEIPSNVLNADAFLDLFDGFSIGSNDLTQLVLGVDRDSELVAPLFDERDPAVLELIGRAVRAARARGREVGICGQAPSDHPEFAEFLVRAGISSISLNPDALLKALPLIAAAEQRLEAERAVLASS